KARPQAPAVVRSNGHPPLLRGTDPVGSVTKCGMSEGFHPPPPGGPSIRVTGGTIVENAADAKAHSCASGHSELCILTNVTEVAERHPRMAEPCENQAHTTTRIAPSPVKGAKLSSRGQATALGTASN